MHDGAIAIVGLSSRFPGAENPSQFWRNLCDGVESISCFSEEELEKAGVDQNLRRQKGYVPARGVLRDVESFDAELFGYSAREAEITDPQQRLFLECAWEALEDAGYEPAAAVRSVGVYAGISFPGYMVNLLSAPEAINAVGAFQALIGNDKDFLSTRVAYKLNLSGPAITVQTACSSSLVAVHLACQALLAGECEMALAGGVSISIPQVQGYLYQEGGILSPDGHCRAFDAQAKGTVAGNGLGIVVLKRLPRALADGDHVYAIIRGTAINNDGSLKLGFTAPSVEGQASVISQALAVAEIEPDTVSYVETHGTGTPLGDPVEISGLVQAFRPNTQKKGYCALGSVKTNIGHLDAAAGIAGLIKTVLALHHKKIPPSLHFQGANEQIDFANSPFYVATELKNWHGTSRRAGVSSFGIGGTNAHVVLEEAPQCNQQSRSDQLANLLVLSARTQEALERVTDSLRQHLIDHPDLSLDDVAYTLQVGRKTFDFRRALVCRDIADATHALSEANQPRIASFKVQSERPVLAMLFPGTGCWPGNALQIYRTEPVFAREVDLCCQLLGPYLPPDMLASFYPGEEPNPNRTEVLEWGRVISVGSFVVSYALAKLWQHWGIEPDVMLGYGPGEYVSACLSGVFSLTDAVALVAERARIIQQLTPDGSVTPVLSNGGRLTDLGNYRRRIEAARPAAPQKQFISSISSTWATQAQIAGGDHWLREFREPVRLRKAFELLAQRPYTFLEIGPAMAGGSWCEATHRVRRRIIPCFDGNRCDREAMLVALGAVWGEGVSVNWSQVHQGRPRRTSLPTYPFDRKRHWVEAPRSIPPTKQTTRRLEKQPSTDWFYVPYWRRQPVPNPSATQMQLSRVSNWLLLEDDTGVGERLAKRLTTAGQSVVRVRSGCDFSRIGENDYVIHPAHCDHYQQLFLELSRRGRLPASIVHLWTVSQDANDQSHVPQLGYRSLVYLAKSLASHITGHPLRLEVISSNIHDVTGNELLIPGKATTIGPCLVIPQEYPNISCRHTDINVSESLGEEAFERLFAHIAVPSAGGSWAHRNGHRWKRAYESIQLPSSSKLSAFIRNRGVYLITGGVGRVGLALAEYLARTAHARLILTSRSPFPPRHEWDDQFNCNPHSALAQKIRKLLRLEELGSEVMVAGADVASMAQMGDILAMARQRFGTLHGVIHCAGLVGPDATCPIEEITEQHDRKHFGPKIEGLLVLEELLQDVVLDCWLLVSSLASVLGGLGFCAYSAANAFLDAYTESRQRRSRVPVLCVNWDGWDFGTAASHDDRPLLAMNEREGVESFDRLLGMEEGGRVAVSTAELTLRLQQWCHHESDPSGDEPANQSENSQAATSVACPTDERSVQQTIAAIWQEVLGVHQIGPEDNFFDLGGHSLLATQVLSRVRATFHADVPLRSIFESSTLAEYVRVVEGCLAEQVDIDVLRDLVGEVKELAKSEFGASLATEKSRS